MRRATRYRAIGGYLHDKIRDHAEEGSAVVKMILDELTQLQTPEIRQDKMGTTCAIRARGPRPMERGSGSREQRLCQPRPSRS